MCGRNSLFAPALILENRFDATIAADVTYRERYNIAPGTHLEVVSNQHPDTIAQYHWGLLPPWASALGDGLINARAETADEKPAFRDAWTTRPCLVLSSGFYEWQQLQDTRAQPHRIHRTDDPAFCMAGLWEETTVNGSRIRSVTIVTTEANDRMRPIHDRMPVILRREDEARWLQGRPDERDALCEPYPANDLSAYPIDPIVNNPRNDHAGIIEPARRRQSAMSEFGA